MASTWPQTPITLSKRDTMAIPLHLSVSSSAPLHSAQTALLLFLSYLSTAYLHTAVTPSVGWPLGWWVSGCTLPPALLKLGDMNAGWPLGVFPWPCCMVWWLASLWMLSSAEGDIFTVRSYEGIFSLEISSLLITLVCVSIWPKISQHTDQLEISL